MMTEVTGQDKKVHGF